MEKYKLNNDRDAANYLRDCFKDLDHEECWVVYLTSANTVITEKMISSGTIKMTFVDNRRIIKYALGYDAVGIILYHNHPSGDPSLTKSDLESTEELSKCCKMFDISLIDHIIISEDKYYSFSEEKEKSYDY